MCVCVCCDAAESHCGTRWANHGTAEQNCLARALGFTGFKGAWFPAFGDTSFGLRVLSFRAADLKSQIRGAEPKMKAYRGGYVGYDRGHD